MAKIFDDPCQQARQEYAESTCPQCGGDERICGGCVDSDGQEGGQHEEEETLSLCEAFHLLIHQDQPDPECEEIHQKVLAGVKAPW